MKTVNRTGTDLVTLRRSIDDINVQLLDLLNTRTMYVKNIKEIKDSSNNEYYDPVREAEMLKNVIAQNRGPLPNELIKEIFSNIFNSTLTFMGISTEKKLLVNGTNGHKFYSIQEMFGLKDTKPVIIAGPCAVENIESLDEIGALLNRIGNRFLRGGSFKPRTSPYDFQGLHEKGLKILHEVGEKYNLLTVTEVVDTRDVELVSQYVDVLQIGARNMQNYELLKEVGQSNHPVLLKEV